MNFEEIEQIINSNNPNEELSKISYDEHMEFLRLFYGFTDVEMGEIRSQPSQEALEEYVSKYVEKRNKAIDDEKDNDKEGHKLEADVLDAEKLEKELEEKLAEIASNHKQGKIFRRGGALNIKTPLGSASIGLFGSGIGKHIPKVKNIYYGELERIQLDHMKAVEKREKAEEKIYNRIMSIHSKYYTPFAKWQVAQERKRANEEAGIGTINSIKKTNKELKKVWQGMKQSYSMQSNMLEGKTTSERAKMFLKGYGNFYATLAESQIPRIPTKSASRHSCSHCNKGFDTVDDLIKHETSHT